MKFTNTRFINGICAGIALGVPNMITITILVLSFIYSTAICINEYELKLMKLKKKIKKASPKTKGVKKE